MLRVCFRIDCFDHALEGVDYVKRFGELLSQAVNATMTHVLGESASELIYSLLERQVFLKREEVGEKVNDFQAYLNRLLGLEVSQVILAASLKELCTSLQREYSEIEKYFSMLDELYEVKFKLLRPSSLGKACSLACDCN